MTFTPRSNEVRDLIQQVEGAGVGTLDIPQDVLPMQWSSRTGGYARSLAKHFGVRFRTARQMDDTGEYTLFYPDPS